MHIKKDELTKIETQGALRRLHEAPGKLGALAEYFEQHLLYLSWFMYLDGLLDAASLFVCGR